MALPNFDRAKFGLGSFIGGFLPRLDYFAQYPGVVTAQNAPTASGVSGTLEVTLDDKRMPGLSNVPLRHGIPGVQVVVPAGVRVVVGFENGKPSGPFASMWSNDASLTTLIITGGQKVSLVAPSINLGNDPGAAAVGRVGDSVKVTIPASSFLISCSGSPAVGVLNPTPIDVTGTITAGSPIVKSS